MEHKVKGRTENPLQLEIPKQGSCVIVVIYRGKQTGADAGACVRWRKVTGSLLSQHKI